MARHWTNGLHKWCGKPMARHWTLRASHTSFNETQQYLCDINTPQGPSTNVSPHVTFKVCPQCGPLILKKSGPLMWALNVGP